MLDDLGKVLAALDAAVASAANPDGVAADPRPDQCIDLAPRRTGPRTAISTSLARCGSGKSARVSRGTPPSPVSPSHEPPCRGVTLLHQRPGPSHQTGTTDDMKRERCEDA